MRAFLIENGTAVQKAAPGRTAADMGAGWVDGPDDVVCGYLYDGETFTTPPAFSDLTSAQTAKLAELAAIRWEREESGTTFGGTPLATDRTTQGKITAAYIDAKEDPTHVVPDWKFGPGVFGSLDAPTIIAAADAIKAHVQACFSHEAALSADIMAAADFDDLDAIDLQAGWP